MLVDMAKEHVINCFLVAHAFEDSFECCSIIACELSVIVKYVKVCVYDSLFVASFESTADDCSMESSRLFQHVITFGSFEQSFQCIEPFLLLAVFQEAVDNFLSGVHQKFCMLRPDSGRADMGRISTEIC